MIFVFGSNLAGRHGKGAALTARWQHGAIYGQGYGRQGNSFAIPTKDHQLRTLPLERRAMEICLEAAKIGAKGVRKFWKNLKGKRRIEFFARRSETRKMNNRRPA